MLKSARGTCDNVGFPPIIWTEMTMIMAMVRVAPPSVLSIKMTSDSVSYACMAIVEYIIFENYILTASHSIYSTI